MIKEAKIPGMRLTKEGKKKKERKKQRNEILQWSNWLC
jgi:hypothetical protein